MEDDFLKYFTLKKAEGVEGLLVETSAFFLKIDLSIAVVHSLNVLYR